MSSWQHQYWVTVTLYLCAMLSTTNAIKIFPAEAIAATAVSLKWSWRRFDNTCATTTNTTLYQPKSTMQKCDASTSDYLKAYMRAVECDEGYDAYRAFGLTEYTFHQVRWAHTMYMFSRGKISFIKNDFHHPRHTLLAWHTLGPGSGASIPRMEQAWLVLLLHEAGTKRAQSSNNKTTLLSTLFLLLLCYYMHTSHTKYIYYGFYRHISRWYADFVCMLIAHLFIISRLVLVVLLLIPPSPI